jgi:multisubunit Na+/H+ antiporter MnhG subunit
VSLEDLAVYVLIAIGLGAVVLACVGVVLAADAYDRLHFVGPSTLGALGIAAAVLVREGPSLIAVKAGLLVAVLVIGSPLVTHATARAARIAARGDWRAGDDERLGGPR